MKVIISLAILFFVLSLPEYVFVQAHEGEVESTEVKEPPKTYIINPDPKKCIPEPCVTISTKPSRSSSESYIEESNVKIKLNIPLKVEENKIKLDDDDQKEIILPSEAQKKVKSYSLQKGTLSTRIVKMDLSRCQPKEGPEPPCESNSPVYNIEVEKEARLFGLLTMKPKISYSVEATTGKVITETKPWYLSLASFLFKF